MEREERGKGSNEGEGKRGRVREGSEEGKEEGRKGRVEGGRGEKEGGQEGELKAKERWEVGGGGGVHVGRMDAGEERGRVSEGIREGRLYTYYMIHYYNRDLIGASVSEPHTSESNWDFSFSGIRRSNAVI